LACRETVKEIKSDRIDYIGASAVSPSGSRQNDRISTQQELTAIYEHVPGILFYVAIEPGGEFRFLSMSSAGLVATGLAREQVVGCLVRDVIPPSSRDLVLSRYRDAIRLGRTVRWREVSTYPAGQRVGDVAVTPVYDVSGAATHLIGIVHDVTDREHLEEALHQREERLAFLLRLNDAVRPLSDPVEIQDTTVRFLGEHLHVNRVVYAAIEGEQQVVLRSYTHDVAPFSGRQPVDLAGKVVLESYRNGDTVAVDDVAADPRFTETERARLLENGVAAFAGMMFYKDGRWLAAFGVHHATPRAWTQDEIALIEETGERMWAAAERARAEAMLRLTHAELQESEERFSVIHDRAPFAISLTHTDGRIVSVNAAFEQLFEFSREEVRGKTRVELGISTPQLNAWLVSELNREGRVSHLEVRRRTKSGAERILLLSIDPVNIGSRNYLLTTAIDVTERRQAEAALRTSEHTLRLSLQAARMGTWRYDLTSGVFRGGKTWKALHGFDPDTAIDTVEAASRRVHPDHVHELQRRLLAGIAEDVVHYHEYLVVLVSGETRWIASQWMREPKTSSLVGVVQDVTARKRAELSLQDRNRDQERTLSLLLETASQGILSLDSGGTIVTANPAVEAMFGWARGELVGRSIEKLLPSGLRAGGDLVGRRRDGSTFPIELSVSHVLTADGGRAIAFVSDISERRQAEADIQASHAALQARTAELEHRTAQLRQLASDLTLAEQQAREQLAKTLHDGLQQLLVSAAMNLDRQVKRDSRSGAGSAEPLLHARRHLDEAITAARSLSFELFPPLLHGSGLPAALTWLAERTRNEYGLLVQVAVDPRANSERKDVRTLLFESVRELLFNAVKHAKVERIALELGLGDDDTLCITVSDQGVGFDPAALVNRTKVGQVGWGLFSISERLALLGGRFEVESAPGAGARFRLIAPRGAPHRDLDASGSLSSRTAGATRNDAASRPSVRPLRILIADDHAAVRTVFRELLEERPELYVVGEASNGHEAVAEAHLLRPDVILMDVSMPVMDGIAATYQLRAELPFIQIFGLSTQPRTLDRHPIEQAGAADFFNKGIDTQRLIDRLLVIHAGESARFGVESVK
jgi:PAS domain S-box-containing protein